MPLWLAWSWIFTVKGEKTHSFIKYLINQALWCLSHGQNGLGLYSPGACSVMEKTSIKQIITTYICNYKL